MADITTFTFKGKTYKQDPNKVEEQKEEAGYIGARFCDKCPQIIQDACHQWCPDGDNGTYRGEDYLELKQSGFRSCMLYGRPEEM